VSNASASIDKSCAKGPDDHTTALIKLRDLSRNARTQDEEKRATEDIEMDANFSWHHPQTAAAKAARPLHASQRTP
jgi:hypothetical protein